MATTLTPLKTLSFLLDGHWVSDGSPVEIRAPYDGEVPGYQLRVRDFYHPGDLPYGIVFASGMWYAVAQCESSDGIRISGSTGWSRWTRGSTSSSSSSTSSSAR